MSTAALAPTETRTYDKTAPEAHQENVYFAMANNLPMIAITGNTYPCKGVLYAMGGKWDKTAKCWMVPQHRAVEAQTIANGFDKPAKTAVVKPVTATAPAQPVTPAKQEPTKVKAKHNSLVNLAQRLETLRDLMQTMIGDLALAKGDDATLIQAHKDLGLSMVLAESTISKVKGA